MAKNSTKTNLLEAKKPSNLNWFTLFILIAFVFYGNTIKNGYSIDDELVTSTDAQKNEIVDKGITGIKSVFTSRYANDGEQNYDYRPITTYSFSIEHSFVGDKSPETTAHISHFIDVCLYGLCGILLFLFLQQLFQGEAIWFSGLVVILYLIHPLHSEIVNNIKTRDELLAVIFCLGASINAFKYFDKRQIKYLIFGVILFSLGLLSRPSAKVFFGIIPLSLYFFRDFKIKKIAIVLGSLFLLNIAMKLFSKTLLTVPSIRNYEYFENPLYFMSKIHRIPMFFYSILRYLGLLIFPYPLKYYYGYNDVPLVKFSDWQFFFGLIVVVFLLFLIWKGLKNKTLISYSILFFFFGIGGIANLLSPAPGIIAERYANIASIGFVMVLVIFLFKWQKWDIRQAIPKAKRNMVLGGLGLLIIPSFFYTVNRNNAWESKIKLYQTDMPKLENSSKANALLATEYMFRAMYLQKSGNIGEFSRILLLADSAQEYFQQSVNVYDGYASSWNNLAVIQFNFKNNFDSTRYYSKKAISIDSTFSEAYFNISNYYSKYTLTYRWLYDDSLLKDNNVFPQEKLNLLNKKITNSGILKALALIMKFQEMSESIKKADVGIDQIRGFIEFIKINEQLEGNYLLELKLSKYLEKLFNIKPEKRAIWVDNLYVKVKGYMKVKLYEILKNDVANQDELNTFYFSNFNTYKDSTYKSFNKLYKVDSKFGKLYNMAFGFSKEVHENRAMINWGIKFVNAFPEIAKGQAYVQIAYAYYDMGEKDSSNYYYQLAMSDKKKELGDLRNINNKSANQNQQMMNLTNEISTIEHFLVEQNKQKEDTLDLSFLKD